MSPRQKHINDSNSFRIATPASKTQGCFLPTVVGEAVRGEGYFVNSALGGGGESGGESVSKLLLF